MNSADTRRFRAYAALGYERRAVLDAKEGHCKTKGYENRHQFPDTSAGGPTISGFGTYVAPTPDLRATAELFPWRAAEKSQGPSVAAAACSSYSCPGRRY